MFHQRLGLRGKLLHCNKTRVSSGRGVFARLQASRLSAK
jgi:hypothetical protein